MSKKNKPRELDLAEVQRLTYQAMRFHGLLPPMSVADVERVEAELDVAELPPCDPSAILKQLDDTMDEEECSTVPITPATSISTETIRNLARAAREGADLSGEIEGRMEDDKSRHQQQETDENC